MQYNGAKTKLSRTWSTDQETGKKVLTETPVQVLRTDETDSANTAVGNMVLGQVKQAIGSFANTASVGARALGITNNNSTMRDLNRSVALNIQTGQKLQQQATWNKTGLEKVGLDVIGAGTDLAMDAILAFAAPHAGTVALATRSFGSSAYEAEQQGKDLGKQFLSGVKSAAIEILTEKIGGPFSKVYGKTALGEITSNVINRVSKNAGANFALKAASGFLSEGLEEIASDILNPLADKLLKLDDGEGWANVWSPESIEQMLYDGLIGGILGLTGASAEGLSKAALSGQIRAGVEAAFDRSSRGEGSVGEELKQKANKTLTDASPLAAPQAASDASQAPGDIPAPQSTQNASTEAPAALNAVNQDGEADELVDVDVDGEVGRHLKKKLNRYGPAYYENWGRRPDGAPWSTTTMKDQRHRALEAADEANELVDSNADAVFERTVSVVMDSVEEDSREIGRIIQGEDEWAEYSPQYRADLLNEVTARLALEEGKVPSREFYVSGNEVVEASGGHTENLDSEWRRAIRDGDEHGVNLGSTTLATVGDKVMKAGRNGGIYFEDKVDANKPKKSNRSEEDAPRASRQTQYSETELAAREQQLKQEKERQIAKRRAENERKGIIKTHKIAPPNSNGDATRQQFVEQIQDLHSKGRHDAAEQLRQWGVEIGILKGDVQSGKIEERELTHADLQEYQKDSLREWPDKDGVDVDITDEDVRQMREESKDGKQQKSGGGSAAEQNESEQEKRVVAKRWRWPFKRGGAKTLANAEIESELIRFGKQMDSRGNDGGGSEVVREEKALSSRRDERWSNSLLREEHIRRCIEEINKYRGKGLRFVSNTAIDESTYRRFGEALGCPVLFFTTSNRSEFYDLDGGYDPDMGVVMIRADAPVNLYASIAAHEFTHARDGKPGDAFKISDALKTAFGEISVKDEIVEKVSDLYLDLNLEDTAHELFKKDFSLLDTEQQAEAVATVEVELLCDLIGCEFSTYLEAGMTLSECWALRDALVDFVVDSDFFTTEDLNLIDKFLKDEGGVERDDEISVKPFKRKNAKSYTDPFDIDRYVKEGIEWVDKENSARAEEKAEREKALEAAKREILSRRKKADPSSYADASNQTADENPFPTSEQRQEQNDEERFQEQRYDDRHGFDSAKGYQDIQKGKAEAEAREAAPIDRRKTYGNRLETVDGAVKRINELVSKAEGWDGVETDAGVREEAHKLATEFANAFSAEDDGASLKELAEKLPKRIKRSKVLQTMLGDAENGNVAKAAEAMLDAETESDFQNAASDLAEVLAKEVEELPKTIAKLSAWDKNVKGKSKFSDFLSSGKPLGRIASMFFGYQRDTVNILQGLDNFDKFGNGFGYKLANAIITGNHAAMNTLGNALDAVLTAQDAFEKSGGANETVELSFIKNKFNETHTITLAEAVDLLHTIKTMQQSKISPYRDISFNFENDRMRLTSREQFDAVMEALDKAVMKNDAAKAYYDALSDGYAMFKDQSKEAVKNASGRTVDMYERDYYPLLFGGDGKANADHGYDFGLDETRFTQHRVQIEGGNVRITDPARRFDAYAHTASNLIGRAAVGAEMERLNRGGITPSITDIVEKRYGKGHTDVIEQFIKDASNFRQEGDEASSLLRTLRLNVQGGALFGNFGSMLKQFPSVFNAAGILDFDSIVHGATAQFTNKEARERAGSIGSIKTRHQGNLDPSVAETLGQNSGFKKAMEKLKILKFAKEGFEIVDSAAIRSIYLASEYQVEVKDGISRDSKEFDEAVMSYFVPAFMQTQPQFDKLLRPYVQTSQSEIVRLFGMFKTQPLRNLNTMIRSVSELRAAKEKYGADSKEYKATEKQLTTTVAGQATASLMFGALGVLAKLIYHRRKDLEDEDGKLDGGKIMARVLMNAAEAEGGSLIFGDAAVQLAIDIASGGKTKEFYGLSAGAVSSVADALDAINTFTNKPNLSNAKKAAGYIATLFGIPLNNAYAVLNSAIMYTKDLTGTNEKDYDDVLKMLDAEAKAAKKEAEKAAKAEEKAKEVSGYLKKPYEALIQSGMTSDESRSVLNEADTDDNNSIKQAELWAWYQAHPDQEAIAILMWESYGWKTSWATYKAKNSK